MNLFDPDFYNEQAKQLWENGRRDEAIRSWRDAIAANPASVEALASLAWALGEHETVEEAQALAERAVAINPDDPGSRRVLGELLFLQGRYADAAEHYRHGLKQEAGQAASLAACLRRDLADSCYMLGQFEDARQEYISALASGGDQAYCRLWLGWTKQQLGDRDGAMSEFGAACELAPDWHEALYAAGQLLCAQGQFARARECLEQALSHYPGEDEEGRAAATCELGNATRGLGNLAVAIDLYRQSLTLDPTHPIARFNLGLAHSELGEYEASLAAFDVAAQLDQGDADIQAERGRALFELGRHAEAIEAYQFALGLQPGNPEAYSGLGLTYYSLGVYDTAAGHYLRAAEAEPVDPWPRYNLAVTLDAAGRHAEADEAMRRAWGLAGEDHHVCIAMARALTAQGRDPDFAVGVARHACELASDNAEAHDALAAALFSAGSYKSALEAAQEAVRLMPETPEYHYCQGMIQEALGDRPLARACFLRAVGLSPDFEEARAALRRLEQSP
jgi:tetratricopeptide (TPR) repeat protein